MQTAEEIYEIALENLKHGNRTGAYEGLEAACFIRPNYSKPYAVRGMMLAQENRYFDAIINYDRSLAVLPTPEAATNKGAALIELNQWENAAQSFLDAILLKPDFAPAWNNLGRLKLIFGDLDGARDAFFKAIDGDPQYVDAHMGLAFLYLTQGNFEEGWEEYEWRRKLLPVRGLNLTQWHGQLLSEDEGILLTSEQGLGDVIQFSRYAPLLKQRYGGKVYLEVRPPLTRLMKTLQGIDGVITYGDDIPDGVKYTTLVMSCPGIFGHSVDEIPSSPSYLSALPNRVELFRPYIESQPGLKVGMCWAGNASLPTVDRRRSTNLRMWEPLAKVDGVTWISLQKGPAADQLRTDNISMTVLNLIDNCEDLADTAALIMNCDLVITIDSAIAHLSAALGKPTWVLSRFDACWRWLGDRRDSPWYPTVTHYRQKKFNDWAGLMPEVAEDLKKFVIESNGN